MENSYNKTLLKRFELNIKKYHIPKNFRMYRGVDLYSVAMEQLKDYKKAN